MSSQRIKTLSAGHRYAVTNSHVIREGGSPVIRLTDRRGDTAIEERTQDDWHHHAEGEDLAVCYLGMAPPDHQYMALHPASLLSEREVRISALGPGDDMYMIGRFISVEGRQKNTPSVRFGHLSMMPGEGVTTSRGLKQVSFLVEMHSLPGYSGSPVFVRVPEGDKYPAHDDYASEERPWGTWLLGVDWGHIPTRSPVRDADGDAVPEKLHVDMNSGLAGVVPAWKLQELLDSDELREERRAVERNWINGGLASFDGQFFRSS